MEKSLNIPAPQISAPQKRRRAGGEPLADPRPDAANKSMRFPRLGRLKANLRAADLLAAITQAAADPKISLEKLDRLVALEERITARAAQAAFARALASLQRVLPVIAERGQILDGAGKLQSRYVLWEDLNEAIRPLLARQGFCLSFRTEAGADRICVTAVLTHRAGHSETTSLRLPLDLSGGKTPIQGFGSSTSYGKRYTAQALLNLTSRGEDDDGTAGGAARISADDVGALRGRLAAAGGDEGRLLAYLGIAALEDLPTARLEAAREAVAAFDRRRRP